MTPPLTRTITSDPNGTMVARFAISMVLRKDAFLRGDHDFTERDEPYYVQKAWELKSAVGPVHSSTFSGPLVATGIAADALGVIRGQEVFSQVQGRMARIPFNINVGRQTGTGATGAWVDEGRSAPVTVFSTSALNLEPRKAQSQTVVTKELVRFGPASERALSTMILGGSAAFVDNQFLLPTATSGPGSITSGGTSVTSTGTTAAQMTADFAAMVAAITTSGRGLVWVMRPQTAARIALVLGAAVDLPRTFLGLPVILSSTSPQQITLADFGEIAFADDGDFDLELATAAAIQMSDAPSNAALDGGSPADHPFPTSLVSLFQTNAVAFRATRWVNWEVVRTGAVAYMTVSY